MYLFLEFCDMGDLSSFIKKRCLRQNAQLNIGRQTHFLNEMEASYIVRDVVRGLAHLSRVYNIMHRDIKLDNILVKCK